MPDKFKSLAYWKNKINWEVTEWLIHLPRGAGGEIKQRCVQSSYRELMFYVTPFEVEIKFP